MQPDTGKLKRSHKKHFINYSDKRKRKPIINDCKTCNTAKSVEPRSFATYDNNRTLASCFLALFENRDVIFLWNAKGEFAKNLHAALFHTTTCNMHDEQTQIWLVFTHNTPLKSLLKRVSLRYCNDAFLLYFVAGEGTVACKRAALRSLKITVNNLRDSNCWQNLIFWANYFSNNAEKSGRF